MYLYDEEGNAFIRLSDGTYVALEQYDEYMEDKEHGKENKRSA